jgi:hypothetical protein
MLFDQYPLRERNLSNKISGLKDLDLSAIKEYCWHEPSSILYIWWGLS